MKPRISFISTCAKEIGLGHYSRSKKLAIYLHLSNKFDVEMLLVGEMPREYNRDSTISRNTFQSIESAISMILIKLPNVVIFDVHELYVRGSLEDHLAQLRAKKIGIISVDNLHEFSSAIDVLIYPSFYIPENIKNIKNCIVKYGWDCYFVEPKNVIKHRSNKQILITTGGSDIGNVGKKLLKLLNTRKWLDRTFYYVQGPYADEVDTRGFDNIQLKIIDRPSDLEPFMLKTDIGFTLFGVSFFEFISHKIPVILYVPKGSKDFAISELIRELEICTVINDINNFNFALANLIRMKSLRDKYVDNIIKLNMLSGFKTIQNEICKVIKV